MTQLVELGATQLIEMGAVSRSGQPQIQSPVLDLFQVVNFLEDPFTGIEIGPGESISPKQRAIAERLRTISRVTRQGLGNGQGLRGLGAYDLIGEMETLSAELNRLGNEANELGKFKIGKALKKVGGKIMKVVKSPAFLSVVGVIANVIPGVGQVASAALMATAAVMAKKQAAAKQKKSIKKAEAYQAAASAQEEAQQIDAYYGQYGASHFGPMGYTPDVWAKLTTAQKVDAAKKLSEGTLQPYAATPTTPAVQAVPPEITQAQKDEMARAAAMSIAMKNVYGDQLPGQGLDLNSLPPDVRAKAEALAPQIQQQIQAAGKENFLATAQKAVGQGSAISSFFSGAGAQLPGGMNEAFASFTGDARKAGEQDIRNIAAAVSAGETTDEILRAGGPSDFPWTIVGVSAGGLALVGGIIYVITRR